MQLTRLVLSYLLVMGLGGCALVSKVSPWERGNLAKKVMIRDGGSQHAALEQHTYSSKEGSAGGYGLGAGGCGCN